MLDDADSPIKEGSTASGGPEVCRSGCQGVSKLAAVSAAKGVMERGLLRKVKALLCLMSFRRTHSEPILAETRKRLDPLRTQSPTNLCWQRHIC